MKSKILSSLLCVSLIAPSFLVFADSETNQVPPESITSQVFEHGDFKNSREKILKYVGERRLMIEQARSDLRTSNQVTVKEGQPIWAVPLATLFFILSAPPAAVGTYGAIEASILNNLDEYDDYKKQVRFHTEGSGLSNIEKRAKDRAVRDMEKELDILSLDILGTKIDPVVKERVEKNAARIALEMKNAEIKDFWNVFKYRLSDNLKIAALRTSVVAISLGGIYFSYLFLKEAFNQTIEVTDEEKAQLEEALVRASAELDALEAQAAESL